MTRRFFTAKQMTQAAPGGSLDMGLRLSAVVTSAPVAMPAPAICPECPPQPDVNLTWIYGTTEEYIIGGGGGFQLTALVNGSFDDWVFRAESEGGGDGFITNQRGPAAEVYASALHIGDLIRVYATHSVSSLELGPIFAVCNDELPPF